MPILQFVPMTAPETPATPSSASPDEPIRVFLSAAEASADLYGAELIRALQRRPGVFDFAGMPGPRMQAAGCRPIADLSRRSSMLMGVVGQLARGFQALGRLDRFIGQWRPHVVVLIDSPFFHLPLARRAKLRGVPVFYFVAPQVWAWGEGRIRKMRRVIDQLACILPFEEEYFAKHGVPAVFVGHPLIDVLRPQVVDSNWVQRVRERGSPVIALFPGSRRQVVREVLPGQLDIAARIRRRFRRAQFVLSLAQESLRAEVDRLVPPSGLQPQVISDRNQDGLAAADLALVASGTITLEVALRRCPMIVMYNHAPLAYELVGRWMIRSRYLSLPNILAGRELVPEFMPYYRTTEPIAEQAIELLSTPHKLQRMADELAELTEPLSKPGAIENTASLLVQCLEVWHPGGPRESRPAQ